jgi:hypothetical protein
VATKYIDVAVQPGISGEPAPSEIADLCKRREKAAEEAQRAVVAAGKVWTEIQERWAREQTIS